MNSFVIEKKRIGIFKLGCPRSLFEKNINNTLVPWFYYVESTNDSSMLPELDTWVVAYHKDYLKFKNVETFYRDGIMREKYNEKCNVVPFDKDKLFKDIEEVRLCLTDKNRRKFVERQTLLGYVCEETKDCIICRGPGVTFILKTSSDQASKLLRLRISLNRKIQTHHIYKFGDSTLELENETVLWTFE